MKYLGYLFGKKNYKYYLTIAIQTVLCVLVLLCFSGSLGKRATAVETFRNTSATVIAYDSLPQETDSFANFERNVSAKKSLEIEESLNVYVYQFLADTEYTAKSVINAANIVQGEFRVLAQGEAALPVSLAKEQGLAVGDTVYVGEVPCRICYLYRDVYQIYKINFSVKQTVLLAGIGTADERDMVNFCIFDPAEGLHEKLENLAPARSALITEFAVLFATSMILVSVSCLLPASFRRKTEAAAFRAMRFAGGKVFGNLCVVELGYCIPLCALTFLFAWFFMAPLLIVYHLLAVVAMSAIHTAIVYRRIKR